MSTIAYQNPAPPSTMNLITGPKCSPVKCKPWCLEGDGHPNDWHIADQGCRSQTREVTLDAWDKARGSELGEPVASKLGVVLVANVDHPMHVEVVLDDVAGHRAGFNMTCEEAGDLAFDLLLLAAQSRGNL